MTSNPFPGLRPFEPEETHLFFGRDGQSEQLILRLGRTRFLAVVGTSGSGKSSLVRAGLLPALQGGLMASAGSAWRVAMFRPGHDPVGNLARTLASTEVFGAGDGDEAEMRAALTEATLRRSGLGLLEAVRQARGRTSATGASGASGGRARQKPSENLLIVVDQFEELFRFRQLIEVENSKEDAAAFVRLLLEAAAAPREQIYVVLTMRSDFLGDCSQFQGLPEAINDGQYLIPRMTRDERRDAVTGPVAVGGGRITEPLVNQLLNDMGDNPDQLPILQHALMRTWDYWESVRLNGEPIDLPHYKAIGGMSEALSLHAEEAYGELGENGAGQTPRQRVAEKLFKALTEKGSDNRETRRPLELRDACALAEADEPEVVAVVETFRRPGRSFLMPPPPVPLDSDSLIDISHESLIRNWARLNKWTEEEAQSARTYKRLAETAVLHREKIEPLLTDPALQFALDWREKTKPNPAWAGRYHAEFDTAMSFLDASVAARDAERKEREKQRRREVSYKRTRLAALLLALSFLLSLAASAYSYNSMSQAKASEARARDSEVRARESEARSLVSLRRAEEARTRAQEERDLAKLETEDAVQREGVAEQAKAEALVSEEKAVDAKAVAERQTEVALTREALANVALKFAEEQSRYNASVAAKNAEETKKTRQILYPTIVNLAQQAYESGDLERGREMLSLQQSAIGDTPGFEWFYLNRLLHNERETFTATGDGLQFVAASPDGKTLVIASGGVIDFRDLATGKTESVPVEDLSVGCLAVSPDGRKLAVGNSTTDEPNVKLFDIATRKGIGSIYFASRSINTVAFTADGKRVIIGSGPNIKDHNSRPFINVWDADSLKLVGGNIPATNLNDFSVSPDNKTIAFSGGEYVTLWDLSAGKQMGEGPFNVNARINSTTFSPDGKSIAVADADRHVIVRNVPIDAGELKTATYDSAASAMAYSPDGRWLALGHLDGTVRICDAKSFIDCAVLKGHREAVTSLSFSADGNTLFSCDNQMSNSYFEFVSGGNTAVKSWDVPAALREQLPVPVPEAEGRGIVLLAYSPDGKTLAATGDNSTVMLLDAETNRLIRTLYESERSVYHIAFSPDGRLLATADDNEVRLWNVSTGAREGEPLKAGKVETITFSGGGSVLVTSNAQDGVVTAWDLASRKPLNVLRGEGDKYFGATYLSATHGGEEVVFTHHNVVEFWDAKLEKRLRQFAPALDSEGTVSRLSLSPDGRFLAVCESHQKVHLYDARTLKLLATLQLQKENVSTIAFSHDGKTLLTGGEYGTLKLWGTVSFQGLLTIAGGGGGYGSDVRCAAFSPDGTKLATVDNESHVRVWRAPASAGASRAATRDGARQAFEVSSFRRALRGR